VADKPPAGKKILGMPRTTGIVVLVLGAAVVGYILVSRMSGASSSSGTGTGSGGGRPSYAGGGTTIVRIIKGHHGHEPRPKPKPKGK
jgi:hypothetical protein